MKIIVCIKQVPNVREVKWNPETGSMIRQGLPSIININDKHAIEAALQLRQIHGGSVTVLSMGPPQVEEALREALAMGADSAIKLSNAQFAASDTWATSYTLGLAIQKIGSWDLILCGVEAMDGNTAQVGPQLAEYLNIPLLSYGSDVVVDGGRIQTRQHLGNCDRLLKATLPALITIDNEYYSPRIPPVDTVLTAFDKDIPVWGPAELSGNADLFGLNGSPTRLRKMYQPKHKKGQVEIIDGTPEEAVDKLVEKLKERQLI